MAKKLGSGKAELLRRLATMDFVCSGTVLRRMKMCGKALCPCGKDKAARHGPYYEWGHIVKGRLVHVVIPPELAPDFLRAAQNYKRLRKLLQRWEREFLQAMRSRTDRAL